MNALTKEDYQQTCEALGSCPAISFDESFSLQNVAPISPQRIGEPKVQRITEAMPSMRAEIAQLPQAQKPQLAKKPSLNATSEFRLNHQLEMILPEGLEEEKAPVPPHANIRPSSGGQTAAGPRGMLYSGWCLRPYAAPRGEYFGATSSAAIKMRKGLSAEEQDDASLLKVIEGYCTSGGQGANASFSGRGRGAGTMSSSAMSGVGQRRAASYPEELRPQLIVAEDEKIFVEEVDGEQVVVKERSLVDTVYALKDQLAALQKEVMSMAKTLDKEQKARRRLEEIVRRSSQHVSMPSTPKPMELPPDEE
ncbi:Protein PIX-1 a [Aphelenchoides avenae]|nr:Protein PIX-1 a [Aphelenchus avenae]